MSKDIKTGKDGKLYFGKGTKGGRATMPSEPNTSIQKISIPKTDSTQFGPEFAAVEKAYGSRILEIKQNDPTHKDYPYAYAPKSGEITCEKCDKPLFRAIFKWDNDTYSGREDAVAHFDPSLNYFMNTSLNNNFDINGSAWERDDERHYAKLKESWCPKCGTVGSTKFTQDAWADITECTNEDCDYYVRYSIGD